MTTPAPENGDSAAPQPAETPAPPAPAPASAPEPDHQRLLAELAGLIRDLEGTSEKPFSLLTSWLAEHGL